MTVAGAVTLNMSSRGINMRDFELEALAAVDIKAALSYIGKKVRSRNLFTPISPASPASPDRQNRQLSINTHPR